MLLFTTAAVLAVLSSAGQCDGFQARPLFLLNSIDRSKGSPESATTRLKLALPELVDISETLSQSAAYVSSELSAIKDAIASIETNPFATLSDNPDLSALTSIIESTQRSLLDILQPSSEALRESIAAIVSSSESNWEQIDPLISNSGALGPIYGSVKEYVEHFIREELATDPNALAAKIPPEVAIFASAVGTYSIVSGILNGGKPPPPKSPYPMGKYDPYTSRLYFGNRLLEVVGRALYITSLSAKYLANLAIDAARSELNKNSDIRALELTELLTQLGPSFIKVGQSLSIRTDLLSPAYVRGLKTLQDQVPPFDTNEARRMIEEELGKPVDAIFSEFSSTPVAAASLGQVYKAILRSNGKEVAVKVQRPGVTNQIALDMHLIREVAPFMKRTFNLNTDLVDVVDKWGAGFVDELDYQQEGLNAVEFSQSIKKTPLAGVVLSPEYLEEYSTGKVLVTEWVDGERLDRCTTSDVTVLCSIAMNTYLTMMLETGILHADPHPGNLLRTPDGKLCILDWGMVTRLEPNLQTTLVEHMAHLTSADYAEVPKDLLLLGFIPENKASAIEDSGIVEVLADIYGEWTKGGGAARINVPKVVSQLQDLQAEAGNLFQIPSYFAYIAKSFSVLEGIGLSNDPNFSIINECLPYVSKRLLTDDKLSGSALNTFIFGPDKSSADRIINYKRVEDLVTGFGEYSTSASGELLNQGSVSRKELIERQADQILDLLLVEDEETPLQTIFFEQLAKIMSSSSRSIWNTVRERSGTLPSGRSVLGALVDPLGIWRTSPLVRVNELDEKTIETTRNLIGLFQEQSKKNAIFDVSTLSNEEVVEISSSLVRKLWRRRFSLLKTGGRLAKQLLQLTADRLEKGERDVMLLRSDHTRDRSSSETEPTASDVNGMAYEHSSRRLQEAARRLETVEAMENMEAVAEVVTVKFD